MKHVRILLQFVCPVLLCLLVAACQPGKEITVLFADGKGIAKADKVYQSGIVIGRVVDLGLKEGKAAVRIRIDNDKWSGLKPPLACYIDADPANASHASMLVRSLGDLGGSASVTLEPGAVIDGVDSLLVWKVLHFARSISDLERSEFWRYLEKQTRGR